MYFESKSTEIEVVEGVEASLNSLKLEQVDTLLISESFITPQSWKCFDCGNLGIGGKPNHCPQCDSRRLVFADIKDEMIKLSKLKNTEVKIVDDIDVIECGGVQRSNQ